MARKPREISVREINGEDITGIDCGKCKQWKPLNDFGKDKRTPSGCKSRCKKCDSESSTRYKKKNESATKEYRRSYYEDNKDKFMDLQRENRRNNKDKHNAYKQVRRARKRALPDTLTSEQVEIILKRLNNKCALTGDDEYELDHFVAINTGHGGTIYENMIPLSRSLNASKRDNNPFEWFEGNKRRFNVTEESFSNLVSYLAELNEMSVNEYRDYVYECYSGSQLEEAN